MQSVWRQTGVKPPELDTLLEMPEVFSILWKDFQVINSKRTSNGYGANPIGNTEILAYYSLMQIEVQPWEIEVLNYFDATMMNLYAEQQEKDRNKK